MSFRGTVLCSGSVSGADHIYAQRAWNGEGGENYPFQRGESAGRRASVQRAGAGEEEPRLQLLQRLVGEMVLEEDEACPRWGESPEGRIT